MKKLIVLSLLVLCLVIVPIQVYASVDTLQPFEDAYVYHDSPDTNYGTSPLLLVYDNTIDNRDRRSFAKFNLSDYEDGTVFSDVTLYLYCYAIAPSGWFWSDVDICEVSDDSWTETGVTWNNQPAYQDVIDTTTTYQIGWHTYNVTDWFTEEFENDKIVSIIIKVPDALEGTGVNEANPFRAREFGNNLEPYVELTIADFEITSFDVEPYSWHMINMTWIDNATGSTRFILQRSIDNETFITIEDAYDIDEFYDDVLNSSSTYYYRVCIKFDSKESAWYYNYTTTLSKFRYLQYLFVFGAIGFSILIAVMVVKRK